MDLTFLMSLKCFENTNRVRMNRTCISLTISEQSTSTEAIFYCLSEIANQLFILGTWLSPLWYHIIISGPSSSFFTMPLISLTSVLYFDSWAFWSTQWVYLQLARHKDHLHCSPLLHLYFNNRSITLVPCIASGSIEGVGETNESILKHLEVTWMKKEGIWKGGDEPAVLVWRKLLRLS